MKRGKALLASLLCAAMALTMTACGAKNPTKAEVPANALYSTAKDSASYSMAPLAAGNGIVPVMNSQMESGLFPETDVEFNTEEYNTIQLMSTPLPTVM